MAKKGKKKSPTPESSAPAGAREPDAQSTKPPEEPTTPRPPDTPDSRRRFLKLVGAGALAAGAGGLWLARDRLRGHDRHAAHDAGPDGGTRMEPVPRPATLVTFNEHQYDTLDALAGILLPADDQDPGARETGAMVYIDRAFATPAFVAGARTMKTAVSALDWQSDQAYAKKFVELSVPEQEAVVQAIYQGEADKNRFKGRTFLTLMMSMTLEGHLSEPTYGGNKDEAGWKLVAFDPLDPRPGHMGGGGHGQMGGGGHGHGS